MSNPKLFKGGIAVDDRGSLSFVNDFDFSEVKRFYVVENHEQGFIRAWHGHKHESKYVFVVKGSALVGSVEVDHWEKPSKDCKIQRVILSEKSPSVYFIPEGYANGFMSLSDDLKIIFFSTSTLEESSDDDIRFDAKYWNIWDIEER
jgi:dTDP-4-dehydrorhamnose 3,5-epimerase-like enzyme